MIQTILQSNILTRHHLIGLYSYIMQRIIDNKRHTQQIEPKSTTNIDLQLNLLKIWAKYKVSDSYQNIFLIHLDQLSSTQLQEKVKNEIKLTIQRKSHYFLLERVQNKRMNLITKLKECLQIEERQLPEQILNLSCEMIKQLRELNLQSAELILKLQKEFGGSRGEDKSRQMQYFNEMFEQLDKDNQFLKKSVMNQYIVFDQGYDPFLMSYYELYHKGKTKTNHLAIKKLYLINISHAYRLMKAKNQILELRSLYPKIKSRQQAHPEQSSPLKSTKKLSLRESQIAENGNSRYLQGGTHVFKETNKLSKSINQNNEPPKNLEPMPLQPQSRKNSIYRASYIQIRPDSSSQTQKITKSKTYEDQYEYPSKHSKSLKKNKPLYIQSNNSLKEGIQKINQAAKQQSMELNKPQLRQTNHVFKLQPLIKKKLIKKDKEEMQIQQRDHEYQPKNKFTNLFFNHSIVKPKTQPSENEIYQQVTIKNYNPITREQFSIDKIKTPKKRYEFNPLLNRNRISEDKSENEKLGTNQNRYPLKHRMSMGQANHYEGLNFQQPISKYNRKQKAKLSKHMIPMQNSDAQPNLNRHNNHRSIQQQSMYRYNNKNNQQSYNNNDKLAPISSTYNMQSPPKNGYIHNQRMPEDNQRRQYPYQNSQQSNRYQERQDSGNKPIYRRNYSIPTQPYKNQRQMPENKHYNQYQTNPNIIHNQDRGRPYQQVEPNYIKNQHSQQPYHTQQPYQIYRKQNKPIYNQYRGDQYGPNNQYYADNRQESIRRQEPVYRQEPINRQEPVNTYELSNRQHAQNRQYPQDTQYSPNKVQSSSNRVPTYQSYTSPNNSQPYQQHRNSVSPSHNLSQPLSTNPNYLQPQYRQQQQPFYKQQPVNKESYPGQTLQRKLQTNSPQINEKYPQRATNYGSPTKDQYSIRPNDEREYRPEQKKYQDNMQQPYVSKQVTQNPYQNQKIDDQRSNQRAYQRPLPHSNYPSQQQNINIPIEQVDKKRPIQAKSQSQYQQSPVGNSQKPQSNAIKNQNPNIQKTNNEQVNTAKQIPKPYATKINQQKAPLQAPYTPRSQNKSYSISPINQSKMSKTKTDVKKQIKMKIGKESLNSLTQILQKSQIPSSYKQVFQFEKLLIWIKSNQTYLTQFHINNKIAIIALCSPVSNAGIALKAWFPVSSEVDSNVSINLFKKYLQFIQKSSTTEKILFSGGDIQQLQQLRSAEFIMKKQRLYERTRKSPARQSTCQFKPFMYVQCSNLKFSQKTKDNILFSEQITPFNRQKYYVAQHIGSLNHTEIPQSLKPLIKFSQNLSDFKEVNKVLTDEQFDNYEANTIKASSINLLRLYFNSPFKSLFAANNGSMRFSGIVHHEVKHQLVVSVPMIKNNAVAYFGKNMSISYFMEKTQIKSSEMMQFGVRMFSKKLYGRLPEYAQGCYGNWQINLTWEDEIQGLVKNDINQKTNFFGAETFLIGIEIEKVMVYCCEVSEEDYIF